MTRQTTWSATTLVRDFGLNRMAEATLQLNGRWFWRLERIGYRRDADGFAKTRRQATIQANRAAAKLGWLKRGSGLGR